MEAQRALDERAQGFARGIVHVHHHAADDDERAAVRGIEGAHDQDAQRDQEVSLTAALFDARVTFLALLAWGGVAAAYTLSGRVLRSFA
jgi:hypothetical protein